ncbi:hypothetical protein PENTCL1PPCAC_18476, partial [Pristionchus entomophagus]
NLLTYVNAWFSIRLNHEKIFSFYYLFSNWTGFLPFLQDFLIGFCYFAQNINSALLTMDRFAATSAVKWMQVWNKNWWLIAVVLYISTGVAYFVTAG